jgi:hypothetical protein
MIERRRDPRRRCLLGGRIEFNNRSSTMDCVIRDQSLAGMKVILNQWHPVPDEFELVSRDRTIRRRVRVVWRDDRHYGVELIAA